MYIETIKAQQAAAESILRELAGVFGERNVAVVGGCLFDWVRGVPCKDIDVLVTKSLIEDAQRLGCIKHVPVIISGEYWGDERLAAVVKLTENSVPVDVIFTSYDIVPYMQGFPVRATKMRMYLEQGQLKYVMEAEALQDIVKKHLVVPSYAAYDEYLCQYISKYKAKCPYWEVVVDDTLWLSY